MAVGKEPRGKIESVENTRRSPKAMEMVAASKMRQGAGMRAKRARTPSKIRSITAHPRRRRRRSTSTPFLRRRSAKRSA